MLILFFLTRNIEFASIFSSFLAFAFFSYGHILPFIAKLIGNRYSNNLLSAVLLLLLVVGFKIINGRPKEESRKVLNAIFIVFFGLIIYNFLLIGVYEITRLNANKESEAYAVFEDMEINPVAQDDLPDIYLIVLDAHTRSDVIKNNYGYDNSSFIDYLTNLGFFVAQCSQANYWNTDLSLGSTFRMDYLKHDEIFGGILPNWEVSPVFQIIRSFGYQIISFKTRVTHNNIIGEDILLSRQNSSSNFIEIPDVSPLENLIITESLSDFEVALIETTWLSAWLTVIANYSEILPFSVELPKDKATPNPKLENVINLRHYLETLYVMEDLPNVPQMDIGAPKFVYAHIKSPHEPFIFDASGEYLWRNPEDNSIEGYRNNVEFLDSQFGYILESIINNSQNPPIIIIMGDHGLNGTAPSTVIPILNAYYFPSFTLEKFYQTITPVNSFRLIFREYFGLDYELLDDESFIPTELGNELLKISTDCNY